MNRKLLALAAATAVVALALPARGSLDYSIVVDIWTDREEDFFYLPGDPMRVYFRPAEDCYILVYQIDTDGNVFLLFPPAYGRAFFARGGVTYCVNDFFPDLELEVYGASGVGYVGVLASPVPFCVPHWLRPHPVFRGWISVSSPWYYGRVVEEPYVAICQINARIIEGWGAGLRLGAGYCWFYVERCYVPVYPIWHRRYWEVRVVTRPVYDRVWAHHDHFYRLFPRKPGHQSRARHVTVPPTTRPFERPRQFRASPAPAVPAWVRETRSDRALQVGYRDGSRQRVPRPSQEGTVEPALLLHMRTPSRSQNHEALQTRSRGEGQTREVGRIPRTSGQMEPHSSADWEDVRPSGAGKNSNRLHQLRRPEKASLPGRAPWSATAPPHSNRATQSLEREAKPQTETKATRNHEQKSPAEGKGAADSRRPRLRASVPRS